VNSRRLINVVAQLSELDDELCIFVRQPWGREADAVLMRLSDDFSVPAEIKDTGFSYFLEVSVALEILEQFLLRSPSLEQITDSVIYYAENDAFPEWAESE